MSYNFTIEETISDTFSIKAESLEEAYNKAISDYNSGEFVLTVGTCTSRHLQVQNPLTNECTEWEEF